MKVVGLVTEYNPFHNGHKYHIEEAKRVTGADYVVAVMSGNFVQRGTPAIIDKYSRTEMALLNGVDLVLELPVCYATGSAEFFAHGAVALLHQLGIVDYLCFGSECGDIRLLNEAAQFLLNTPASFETQLQSFLKDGMTYPVARLKALQCLAAENNLINGEALSHVLAEPNNILGIEYLKAIHHLNSSIQPVTIQRIAAHYHDHNLATQEDHTISSATAIRRAIPKSNEDTQDCFSEIRHSVPDDVFRMLTANYRKTFPITEDDFAQVIKYKLLTDDNKTLAAYLDITNDLADRLTNISAYEKPMAELAQDIKTKNMTLTRINRALIHILLNIRTANMEEYNLNGYTRYARVLGVKKESSHLLRNIEKSGRIPIITKVSKADKQLDALGMRMLEEDLFAAHIYNQAIYDRYGTIVLNEYKRGVCIL